MARLFSIRPAITLRGRKFKGLRGYAGKPFHPPLTDVPVTCFVLAAIFDLLSFITGGAAARNLYAAGTYVLAVGVVAAIPTALTGFWDWLKSTPKHTQAWRTANWHMAMMLTTTVIAIVDLAIRIPNPGATGSNAVVTLLSVIVGVLVSWGATYGGSLVYDYGFNVETSGDHPVWHETEEDVFPGHR